MIDRTIEFPSDFVWGSAAAAHQVEGDNRRNDWWAHEHASDTNAIEPSGVACDHYHRFAEDFRLFKSLGHAAHRLSIEWSRIEPEPGRIDEAEIAHYRTVLTTLREIGMEPWVTLHHFTSPLWFAERGGFSRAENVDAFRRFAELLGRRFGDLVAYWCTINEPTIYAEMGYRYGYFPPRLRDDALAADTLCNLFRAHAAVSDALRATVERSPHVGITLAVQKNEPYRPESEADRALAARRNAETTGVSVEALRTGVFRYPGRAPVEIPGLRESSTFVGVQYYSRMRWDAETNFLAPSEEGRVLSHLSWEVYPEGFAPVIREVAASGLPVVVTENGMAHDDDRVRVEYVADHLAACDQVRREGVDLRGYFYWSAMDNFEWNFGYGPKFGLIAVDRATLARTPRPSAHFFAEIARTGRVTPALVRRYQAAGR